MDTNLTASVATFRVYSSTSSQRPASASSAPTASVLLRSERMGVTLVTEGPLVLSRLATNEINYLQVNNFTRAIMPRSRIWRVSSNELVIPASFTNYWLITLNGSRGAIARLDRILKGLCKYEITCAEEDVSILDDTEIEDTEDVQHELKESDRVLDARQTISRGGFADRMNQRIESDQKHHRQHISSEHSSPTKPVQSKHSSPVQSRHSSPTQSKPVQSAPVSSQSSLGSPELEEKRTSSAPLSQRARSGTTESVKSNLVVDAGIATPPVSPPWQAQNQPLSPLDKHTPSPKKWEYEHITPTKPVPEAVHYTSKYQLESDEINQGEPLQLSYQESLHLSQQKQAISEREIEQPSDEQSMRSTPPPEPLSRTDSDLSLAALQMDTVDSVEVPLVPDQLANKRWGLETRFEPRFSHPLIPNSHVSRYYPTSSSAAQVRPRLSLQRRELTTVGPSSLHQEVTTVGGYIGLRAVKGLLKKT